MNDSDFTQLDRDIDRAIDELNAERAPVTPQHDEQEFATLVDTARMLRRLREPDWPDEGFADTLAGNLESHLTATGPAIGQMSQNGHGSLTEPTTLLTSRRRTTLRLPLAALIRTIGTCVLAGMVTGIVVGGIGGRIVMRISAFMFLRDNPDAVAITESSGRQVGTFSIGGTVNLLIETAFIGMVGGIAYAIVKHWLPRDARFRGVTFGVILLMLFGIMIIDSNNQDFQRFGPPALNLAMFASIFILFGVVFAPVAHHIESWLTRIEAHRNQHSRIGIHRVVRLMTELIVFGAGALGIFVLFVVVTFAALQVTISLITIGARITGISQAGGTSIAVDLLITYAVFVLAVVAPIASVAQSKAGKDFALDGPDSIARPLARLQRRSATVAMQALLSLGLIIGVGFTVRTFILILTATS